MHLHTTVGKNHNSFPYEVINDIKPTALEKQMDQNKETKKSKLSYSPITSQT